MTAHDTIDLSQCLDYRGKHEHPHYATMHAAGLDLLAEIDSDIVLEPGFRTLVPTGLWLNLPENTEMQIRPKSGMAFKFGVIAFNGTIDADYREQVGVLLFNHGSQPYQVVPGAKIAQGVFAPVIRAAQGFTKHTRKRTGGFGSTGA